MLLSFVKKMFANTLSSKQSEETSDHADSRHLLAQLEETPISSSLQEKLRYESLLANIGEGLVVTDKSGHIITFNKAAVSILGWSEQEAIGRALSEIIDIEYNNQPETGGAKSHTLYFIRKDKTKFPVATTVTSYVQGTNILGTITLFRDITNEQNIDRMKNEFISLASHQLRTPLAAIKWYTSMLIKGDAGSLSSEQLKYMESVNTSTERMIDLVNSLLNISRIESGRIIVEPAAIEVKKFIEEIVDEVKIRYADKKQQINLTIPDNFPHVTFDPRLIRQVYVNLLTNAAKYTPEKGNINVKISQKDTDMISEVSDNGYGIPENEQNKMFEKFYRGTNILTQPSDGTGLGLYFIKSIIELSQGKIWYKSKVNEGTTFWFSLPLAGTPAKKGAVILDN